MSDESRHRVWQKAQQQALRILKSRHEKEFQSILHEKKHELGVGHNHDHSVTDHPAATSTE